MFINLANEFVFGTKILDVYSNINKKEKNSENIVKKIIENENEICQRIKDLENNKNIVVNKFGEQIKNIDDNVYEKIIKVFDDNIFAIKNEIGKFIKDDKNTAEIKDKLINIIKLFN